MQDVLDTKTRILQAAFNLFSDKGFEGTSMREIAKRAEVNLSAINYHFQSKEKLCSEVLNKAGDELREELKEIAENHPDLKFVDLVPKVYQHLVSISDRFQSCFRILSTGNVALDLGSDEDGQMGGGPGARYLMERLTKEVGECIPFEDRCWVVNAVFCQMTHLILLCNTSIAQIEFVKAQFETKKVQYRLRRLCLALVREITDPLDTVKTVLSAD
ncbi:MAG: TetR/AcrR family transcriptional regulator [Oligoflexales bacterium]|nr:TetR/AcrR family transcriptional regulator [Oligoflexales bacterium]